MLQSISLPKYPISCALILPFSPQTLALVSTLQLQCRGPGVVGEQPTLQPGQSFCYSSYCQMPTAKGTMEGCFEFVDVTSGSEAAGRLFDVRIGKFGLDNRDAVPPNF